MGKRAGRQFWKCGVLRIAVQSQERITRWQFKHRCFDRQVVTQVHGVAPGLAQGFQHNGIRHRGPAFQQPDRSQSRGLRGFMELTENAGILDTQRLNGI